MALPSEAQSEWTDTAIDNVHKLSSVRTESLVSSGSRICAHCGAEIGVGHFGPPRRLELIFNYLCVVLLIAVALFAGYLLNSWVEWRFDNFFHHPVWHEPLDDWNL